MAGYNSFPAVRGCRIFSSIPGVYHLMPVTHTHTPCQVVTTKNVSSHCQISFGRQKNPQLRTTVLNEKRTFQALTKNLFFSIPSTCQCDSLFPANPTSHKWLIYEFPAPDDKVLSSNPRFPPPLTSTPDMLLSACQGRDFPVPFTLSPGPGSIFTSTPDRGVLKVQVKAKANLPVLHVGQSPPVPGPSFPNLSG